MLHNSGLSAQTLLLIAVFSLLILTQNGSGISGTVAAAPGQGVTDFIVLGDGASTEGVQITVTPSSTAMMLNPNLDASTLEGSMEVIGSGDWTIRASADIISSGYPAEYDTVTSSYVFPLHRLGHPLKIRACSKNGNWTGSEIDLSSRRGVLIDSRGRDEAFGGYMIYFNQTATLDDEILPPNHRYRIVVTFIPQFL